jgi:emfourin
MTKISFKKNGGIMGREVESNIDLNEMPENESQEIQRLILDSNFFNIPQNLIEPSGHDEYEYTVTVDAGNSHHTVHTTDSSAPESLQPLLEKLSALTKEGNSRSRTA